MSEFMNAEITRSTPQDARPIEIHVRPARRSIWTLVAIGVVALVSAVAHS